MAEYKFNTVGQDNQTNMVPNPTIPLIFKVRGYPWESYGQGNDYPSFITELYAKSAINRRALQAKILGVFGEGLRTVDPSMDYVLGRANDGDGGPPESWNDVFEKIVTDYEIYGGFACNVIWNATGDRIHSFYHIPFPAIRSGEIDVKTDKVEKYYYSSNWNNFRKFRPIEYQAFDPNCAIDYPSQMMYFFDYNPQSQYYPIPSYSGSLQDITIDIEVSNFHLSNLANGLNPSLFISFRNGTPSIENQKQIYDSLTANFSGTQNTGRFFCSFSDGPEQAPEVTPITSANDDYYVNLETRITSRILTGHGITSPLLLGLYHQGGSGLGSNKDEILVSYESFKNTVLRPDIKALLKPMDKLMYYHGYNTKLYIEPLKLFPEGDEVIDNSVETAVK
jgi:hypothetical protein